MKRARNSFFMGSWSVMVFLLAVFALLVTSTGANAQVVYPSLWKLDTQKLDYYRAGSSTVLSASAILTVTDTKSVWKNNYDGAVVTGSNFGTFILNNEAKKQVIANAVPGGNLTVYAVIEGVSPEIVTALKQRSSLTTIDAYASAIINNVTAKFDANLFGLNSTAPNILKAISVAGLQPSGVTAALSSQGVAGVPAIADTTVVVAVWDYSDVVVSATNPELVSKASSKNKVSIFFGSKSQGDSNYVGIEIPGKTSPAISAGAFTFKINKAWDTTSNGYYGPSSYIPIYGSDANVWTLPEFRAGDIIEASATITQNRDYTGEPADYFPSATSSDSILLVPTLNSYYTVAAITGGKSNESSATITNSSGTLLIQTAHRVDSAGPVFNMNNLQVKFAADSESSSEIVLYVSGQVSNKLYTQGPYATIDLSYAFTDDIDAATTETTSPSMDTAPLYIVNVASSGRAKLWGSSDFSSGLTSVADNGYVQTDVYIDPMGEKNAPENAEFTKWLNVYVKPTSFKWDYLWNSVSGTPLVTSWSTATKTFMSTISSSASGLVYGTSTFAYVPSITAGGSGSNTLGVKFTAYVKADAGQTVLNAGVIVGVSDDARNPAIAYTITGTPVDNTDYGLPTTGSSSDPVNYPPNLKATPEIQTASSFWTIADLNGHLYKNIAAVTTAIDNAAPLVTDVNFISTGFPSGYGPDINKFNGLIRDTTDTLTSWLNSNDSLYTPYSAGAYGQIFAASPLIQVVTRATAHIDGTDGQSGSPVMAVVRFQLSTTVEDNDALLSAGDIASRIKLKFKSSGTAGDQWTKLSKPWTAEKYFADADSNDWKASTTQLPVISGNTISGKIATVTFELSELPAVDDNYSDSKAFIYVRGYDRFLHTFASSTYTPGSDAVGSSITSGLESGFMISNDLLVDVSRPVVIPADTVTSPLIKNFRGSTLADSAAAPSVILIVTNVGDQTEDSLKNKPLWKLMNTTIGSTEANLTANANNVDATPFINSYHANWSVKSTTLELAANSMIIINASFEEPLGLGDANVNSPFIKVDEAFFPYVLESAEKKRVGRQGTLYGKVLKTISADFSDFDTAASDVTPSATTYYAGTGTVVGAEVTDLADNTKVVANNIVEATWYFKINGSNASLNATKGTTDLRSVRLIARDLSGNITKKSVPVGMATFTKATPTIVSWKIFNKVTSAYIIGGPSTQPSAFDISAATFNLDSTTMELAVKVDMGNGSAVLPRENISADFKTLFGAKDAVSYPVASSYIPNSVATGNIAYATFLLRAKEDTGTALMTPTNGNTVTVLAKNSNGVSSSVTTAKGIEVDRYSAEFPLALNVVESVQDGVLRPNEAVTIWTRVNTDVRTPSRSQDKPLFDLTVAANLSDLGLGTAESYDSYSWVNESKTILDVTWYRTIGLASKDTPNVIVNVTDGVYNSAPKSVSKFVDVYGPSANNIILYATNEVSYVTKTFVAGVSKGEGNTSWYKVGEKQGTGSPSYDTTYFKNNATVGIGDGVKVVARFNVNDSVYKNIATVTGDFSMFDPALTNVYPVQTSSTGSISTATWFITVSDKANITEEAFGKLFAIDASGLTSGSISTPVITVDATAPLLSSSNVAYYYKGTPVTDKIGGTARSINDVSATVKFVIDFSKDGANFTSGDRVRYPGSLLDAVGVSTSALSTVTDPTELFSIDGRAFGLDRIIPDGWDLSGAGPRVVVNQKTVANAATIALIKASTNTILTVTADGFGGGYVQGHIAGSIYPGLKLAGKIPLQNLAQSAFVINVTNHIGNVGAYYPSPIVVDTQAPAITSVTLEIDPTEVNGVDYLKALYAADGVILRPTRVTVGTKMIAMAKEQDPPSYTEPFVSDATSSDFGVTSGPETMTPPSTANKDTFMYDVYSFAVGNDAVSTYPLKTADVDTAIKLSNYDLKSTAKITFMATDTVVNKTGTGYSTSQNSTLSNGDYKGYKFEVDKDWPGVISQSISYQSTPDLSDVVAMSGTDKVVNAVPGNYLIWAAKLVIDGSETSTGLKSGSNVSELTHLQNFKIMWDTDLNKDVKRLDTDPAMHSQGWKFLIESATRSIVLVTDAIKIKLDASPSDKFGIAFTMQDALGNAIPANQGFLGGVTKVGDGYVPNRYVAVNAVGPKASEIALLVKKPGDTSYATENRGIGRSIDSVSTTFEMGVGSQIIVGATISTVEGKAPSNIYLDLSDLYPAGMANSVSRVLPSKTYVTANGRTYAEWSTIAYDFSDSSSTKFPVNSRRLIANNQVGYISELLDTAGGKITDVTITQNSVNQARVKTVTEVDHSALWISSQDMSKTDTVTSRGKKLNQILNTGICNLSGLPYIEVQRGAEPKNIASVTVFVEEKNSMFPSQLSSSEVFTVDSKSPSVIWTYQVKSRGMAVKDFSNISGRTTFPVAPNISSKIPNRVRQGDVVYINGQFINPSITLLTDDGFRDLEDSSVFLISSPSMLEVTADLSAFNETMGNASAAYPEITITPRANLASLVDVTYTTPITGNVGNTTTINRTGVEPVFTLLDDVGNNAAWNWFETDRYAISNTYPVSVDNIPPVITTKLSLVLLQGNAKTNSGVHLNAGQTLFGNEIVSPGAVLGVTVTVSDAVDHPLDVMNNSNYSNISLQAKNITVPAGNIQLVTLDAQYIFPDDVRAPFKVTIPSNEEGVSTDAFTFVIHATDTIGNWSSATSATSLQFDGKPRMTVLKDGQVVTAPFSYTVNAGSPLILSASAFDVSGVTQVEWLVPTLNPDEVVITAGSANVFDITAAPFRTNQASGKFLAADLKVNPIVVPFGTTLANQTFTVKAEATDDSNSVVPTGDIAIKVNQPALFDEIFAYSADSVTDATVVASVQGLNSIAGEDVREVTVVEGEILSVDIAADDANEADGITLAASSIAFATDSPFESASFGSATAVNGVATAALNGPTVGLEIVTGYLAVTGTATSATYTVDISATDGIHPKSDQTRLLINVVAKSATPAVIAQTVSLDGVPVDASAAKVTVKEGSTLVIVTQVADAGGEELTFAPSASDAHIVFTSDKSFAVEASGRSVITATVAYTPGFFDASIIDVDRINAWDPFTFNFAFANSSVTTNVTKTVDIENVSQPPLATAKYSVNGAPFVALENNGTIGAVNAGSTVVIEYLATDPDGKLVYFPAGTKGVSLNVNYAMEESARDTNPPDATVTVTIHAPAKVDETNNTAVLTIVSTDADNSSTTTNYNLLVKPNVIARVDEVVFSAGMGGKTTVQTRNFDKNNGSLFTIINSFFGMPPTFLPVSGGGDGRATYVSIGDVDGDNQPEDVISFSAATVAGATFPNVLYVRDAVTKQVLEGSAIDPFVGVANPAAAAYYRKGEIKTAVGNFIGTSKEQVVAVQGFGGNQVLRLLLWDGATWGIKAQFNAIEDSVNDVTNEAKSKNLNGQVNVVAADFNGDGIDELVAGQGNSASSETYVQVVEFTQTAGVGMAGVANRIEFKAFDGDFLGLGGVTLAVCDINGDATPELIVSSTAGNGGLISFFKPNVDEDGKLVSFTRMGPDRNYQDSIFSAEQNPSGVLNIAAGEFDGKVINGDEMVIATGSLVASDGITSVSAAPANLFRIIKVSSEGDAITSFVTPVLVNMGAYQANLGQKAGWAVFQEAFAPTSGAINVAVSDLVTPVAQ